MTLIDPWQSLEWKESRRPGSTSATSIVLQSARQGPGSSGGPGHDLTRRAQPELDLIPNRTRTPIRRRKSRKETA